MAVYRAKEGEMVDEICHMYYGKTRGVVERVLAANKGLASLGPRLPAGTLVELPDFDEGGAEPPKVKMPWS
ncbi:tail protein X [Aquisalimonas asiatica]|uniref:P2-like prophage tail protein X n=1 Tax=Aquisalimonas asiatica TaxID=406100 RepID=A0A1H8RSI4_9GAMM|nr:tail protein X [Aquisalimonas asiatica]SEO69296.1 P2-like prophage tail protein X [Aquisalimonas asiatica]